MGYYFINKGTTTLTGFLAIVFSAFVFGSFCTSHFYEERELKKYQYQKKRLLSSTEKTEGLKKQIMLNIFGTNIFKKD